MRSFLCVHLTLRLRLRIICFCMRETETDRKTAKTLQAETATQVIQLARGGNNDNNNLQLCKVPLLTKAHSTIQLFTTSTTNTKYASAKDAMTCTPLSLSDTHMHEAWTCTHTHTHTHTRTHTCTHTHANTHTHTYKCHFRRGKK